MKHHVRESQRIVTDYAAFTMLIVGYLWGCFSTYSFLNDVVVNWNLILFRLKIRRRIPIIYLCGGFLIGYVGYALGLETIKFDISALIFNIWTAFTPIALYLCVKKPCLHH